MARPTGWDILGLDGDPTPGVVESVQALAKQFGDFAHDVESAYRSLNSFGSDATAMQWVGQTADAFKDQFGPLPGRLQKLYTSYSEASDALNAYAPQLQAAQSKADSALRQAQDANADLQRATTNANSAAADLKTAQQNHAASPNPQAVTDAQTAHDTAQTNLTNAKAHLAALAAQANQAHDDRITAAKACAGAIGHAQSDGIHNKHWWEHVGAALADIGGEIADIAGEIAPILDIIALATSWIPGVDVVTAALAEADNLVALAGSVMQMAGDAMQGKWGDALLDAGMLAGAYLGGKALEKFGGPMLEKLAARGNKDAVGAADPVDVVSGRMITAETDLSLPGTLPLVLRRSYSSGYLTGHSFGPGWSSTLDIRVAVAADGIRFAGDDAQVLRYPLPTGGEPVLPADGARWELTWDRGADEIRVADRASGLTQHFAVVHFAGENGHIRSLTAVTDRHGNRVDVDRDAAGVPTAVRHSGGYHVRVETEATGSGPRIKALWMVTEAATGAAELVAGYRYDEQGRLAAVLDPAGVPYRYEHDENDHIRAWINRSGYRYEYEYDEAGRVVRGTGTDGYLSAGFVYDEEPRTTTVIDSLGGRTTFHYDESGHLSRTTDPLGNVAFIENDAFGRMLSYTDPLGAVTRLVRDAAGNVVRMERADGSAFTTEFDRQGRPVRVLEPDGAEWLQHYDERGNLVRVRDPLGAVTSYGFDETGALRSVTDALGHTVGYDVDAAGVTVAVTDALGSSWRATRDAFGRLVEVVDPTGARTETGWDPVARRPAWQRFPDGSAERWEWDADGELLSHQDAAGGLTRYEPGPFHTVRARVEADGTRYEFAHDSQTRLTTVSRPGRRPWSYSYDPAGRLVSETDFNGRTLRYDHDAANQLVRRRNAVGQVVELSRDRMGRVVRHRDEAGNRVEYGYDDAGRLARAENAHSRLEFVRDGLGRAVSQVVDGTVLATAFDAVGRRTERTTPSGHRVRWRYDAAGRPSTLERDGAAPIAFGFDAAGRETSRRLSPAAAVAMSYDERGRLAAQQLFADGGHSAGRPAAPVLERAWTYRADGVPTSVTDSTTGQKRFALDRMGRVTAVQAATWTETYAYDGDGRLAHAADSRDRDSQDLDSRDRDGRDRGDGHGSQDAVAGERVYAGTLLSRAGRTRYEYDEQGRRVRAVRKLLSGGSKVWTYSYDAFDRLVETVTPSGERWRNVYDPLGRRIAKQLVVGDEVVRQTRFVWDQSRLAETLQIGTDAAVSTVTTWEYGPGSFTPLIQDQVRRAAEAPQEEIDARFFAIIADLVGTPTELVAQDGSIPWRGGGGRRAGTAFGGESPDADCPIGFPGQYHDEETGLDYNYHRFYDPETGRYLTADPLGLAPAPDPHGYVANPLIGADPLGLDVLDLRGKGDPRPGRDRPWSITPGGRGDGGQVVAGHGWYNTPDGFTTVPDGTYLHFYVQHGEKLDDSVGTKIERGARDVMPVQTYGPGERVPNYIIGPPDELKIMSGSTTVDQPKLLSELFDEGTIKGVCHMAVCREVAL
ncbi:putative adhesin [Catenulispora rubra]|uniref:putative adhesin n=1 Tax=Catenulispora rubra TaxID=280293 RepID=UPI0018927A7D|nr:DUF6531 domain-containing protein [Catenulispora rubra]